MGYYTNRAEEGERERESVLIRERAKEWKWLLTEVAFTLHTHLLRRLWRPVYSGNFH